MVVIAAALGALVVALYPGIVLGGGTFALRDHATLTIPFHAFIRESLLAGRLPQWWDRVGVGIPFAANPVFQALSPVTWIFSLLPQPLGANLEPLWYLWVFGMGTALLSSRLGASPAGAALAGALAEGSGYLSSLVVNGNMPHVAWMPWVAWSADRLATATGPRLGRPTLLLGVFSAGQMLGPEPGNAITTMLLAAVIVLVRAPDRRPRRLAFLAGAVGLSTALAAVVLVPAFHFRAFTSRAGGISFESAASWSLHPLRLLELAWPGLLGDRATMRHDLGWLLVPDATTTPGFSWSFSVFVGAPALVLAAFGAAARRERALLAASLAFLVLSLGASTPLFGFFRSLFPPERFMRYPEKHVLGTLLLVWALAGVGWTRLAAGGSRRLVVVLAAALGLLGASVGALALSAPTLATVLEGMVASAQLTFVLVPAGALAHVLRGGVVAVASLALVAIGAELARRRVHAGLGAALAGLAMVGASGWDVRAITPHWVRPSSPPALLAPVEPGAPALPLPGDQPGRAGRGRLRGSGVPDGGGQHRGVLRRHRPPGIRSVPGKAVSSFWDKAFPTMTPSSVSVLFGAPWAIFSDFTLPGAPSGEEIARSSGFRLVRWPWVRPRAFVASQWVSVASERVALDALSRWNRDPAVVAVQGSSPFLHPGPLRPCQVESPWPERVELSCESGGGFAVLLDTFAEGWTATVDDLPASMVCADGLFRAVALGPGAHRVVFSYRTPGLQVGFWITASTVLALVALWWLSRERRSLA